jgi:hypothetical protein
VPAAASFLMPALKAAGENPAVGYAAIVAVQTLKQIEIQARAAVSALEHSASLAEAAKTSAKRQSEGRWPSRIQST